MFGKCQMCRQTNLLPGMDHHEDPKEMNQKEAIEAERNAHTHS